MNILPYALAAVRRGWTVFPCESLGKRPAVKSWAAEASSDPGQVRQWFESRPYMNYGIATKPSGLVVVDCDTKKENFVWPEPWDTADVHSGEDVLMLLAFSAGDAGLEYTNTFTVRTPSGGLHLYYAADPQRPVRNTASKIGPLIDSRGGGPNDAGGYILGPGSVIGDAEYKVEHNHPATLELPPLPGWLHDAATVQPVSTASAPSAPGTGSSSVAAFLGSGQGRVAGALEFLATTGSQVQRQGPSVFWCACVFAAESRPQSEAFAQIWPIVAAMPLGRPNEPWLPIHVQKTIESAYSQPRE